jgi:hypothetical protein
MGSTVISNVIWCVSSLFEAALIWRLLQTRLFTQFPVFFGYIAFVFSESIVRVFFYSGDQGVYAWVYWSTEFMALILGCCVMFEVYRKALAPYPGTAKMARNVLLFLFALALARAVNVYLTDPGLLLDVTSLHIERAMRTFQAIAIVSLLSLFLSYSIPFSSHLRGILMGYSLFVSSRVLALAFVGETGKGFWYFAYSACYITAVGIWLTYLNSAANVPHARESVRLERDYNVIAAATQQRLQEARDYLRKVGRL